ncbi:hypothetical protein RvY_16092 [Ramazzottius varieornatus]|uniref:Uncharacterized protein n=1 Tax=Ramazzottius varieornatus TaxID=947166 RepID=A0A1D1W071_RAMVA|nr:hypothetical protein RvY_16092 [Ramazzottius varieornatus]
MPITEGRNESGSTSWRTAKLTELHNGGFLDEPDQVWNLGEYAFNTAEMFDRVAGRKGMRQVYSQYDGTEKGLVTILPCGNAAELQLPFMALFSGKRHV